MEILLLSSTIIISITSKKIHKVYFMNELIKKNYKLDNYYYDKSLIYIIPIINIAYLIKNIRKYNINNLDYLNKNNLIIPLTEKEIKLYNNYSNIATVLNINIYKNNKSNMIVMDLENHTENTLYITNEHNNYIINYSKGPISKLSKKEQYEYLKKELTTIEEIQKPKVKTKR